MNFEFLEYISTPGEKHLGICKVKCWGKIVLRYKIVQKKEGNGWFPNPASYKVMQEDGSEAYVSAFVLDSNSDKEDLEALIRLNMKRYLNSQASLQAPQAYTQSTVQQNPNPYGYAQQATPPQQQSLFNQQANNLNNETLPF